jgi:exosortase D (VPLPA-CTERM-specific)
MKLSTLKFEGLTRPLLKKDPKTVACFVTFIASFALLYHDVVINLVRDWATSGDNYSHGFLIVPIALYFTWERRNRLAEAPRRPNHIGLIVVFGSLSVLLLGLLGSELFLTRISLFGTLSGTILFLYGWQHLRILAFPLVFLLLMIPLPRIIFDQIVFPLQLVASYLAEVTLSAFNVPVLREGNLIVLAHSTLEVAEACSGIRSLISLLTLGIIYGYVMDRRRSMRTALAIGTVPVAIIANGFRVAGTGLAAQNYGAKAAEAFFDTFSGWILFTVAFFLLFVLYRLLLWIAPLKERQSEDAPLEEMSRGAVEPSSLGRAMIITVSLVVAAIFIGEATTTQAVAIREPLNRMPLQVGEWQGQPAEELSDQILAKIGVDEYLSRFYSNPGHALVHSYVGYYASQRQGDTIHSPKNCLPGAGWLPVKSDRIVIPVTAGESIEVNRYVIQKGLEKQVVLYWYQSHGRVIASEYWAKIYLVMDAIRMNRTDGAFVRVISPVLNSEKTAERHAVNFIRDLFPLLNRHLPD